MSRRVAVALACILQLALGGGAVAPSLSARVTGEEYLLAVAPVDPIDPFRGAYVTLDYPGLRDAHEPALSAGGTVYVPLVPVRGSELWRGGAVRVDRPADGPFLLCNGDAWPMRCGIESLFVPQAEARRLEDALRDGGVARIRVDGRGNAAVVAVDAGS